MSSLLSWIGNTAEIVEVATIGTAHAFGGLDDAWASQLFKLARARIVGWERLVTEIVDVTTASSTHPLRDEGTTRAGTVHWVWRFGAVADDVGFVSYVERSSEALGTDDLLVVDALRAARPRVRHAFPGDLALGAGQHVGRDRKSVV